MRFLRIALALGIIGFVISALYIAALVFQRQPAVEGVGLGNVTWTVAQAPSEFARLEQRVSAFGMDNGTITADEVKLRFDIVVNRVKALRGKAVERFVLSDARIGQTIDELEAVLDSVRPLIADIASPGMPARILSILAPIYPKLVRLSTDANVWNIEQIASDRQGIFDLQWAFATVAVGMIVCGCALILLLLLHNGLLARAQRELQQKERSLALQNARFDDALEAMSLGLCLLDANYRIIVYNARFVEIFGLERAPPELGSLIFEHLDKELLADDADAMERSGGKDDIAILNHHAHHLPNGTVLLVSREPTSEGGWVCTFEDITERHRAQNRVVYMAHHDSLTHMPNRLLFWESIEQALAKPASDAFPCAVLYLDLDRFKEVNDTLGHPVGDALLRQVAQRLRQTVSRHDVVARLGGDEFAVLHECTDNSLASTEELARKVIEQVGQPYQIEENEILVSTSIGIAVAIRDGSDADQLMKNADLALYGAKGDGGNAYRFYSPAMDKALQSRRSLEADLRRGIELGQFELYYQPLVNLQTGVTASGEALMRWHHPEHGQISPAQFIPLAEETGLIESLGEWALRRACQDALNWPEHVRVSVNLSAVQFRKARLVEMVKSALASSRLDARRLEVEITESVLLKNNAINLKALHELRSLGITIALDDFGTGYSSLSYLQRFPIDKLKIDQSFVRNLETQPDSFYIVQSVATLARNLGMLTTAEGVETLDQLAMAVKAGCTEAQGYHFSRPIPEAEFRAILRSGTEWGARGALRQS